MKQAVAYIRVSTEDQHNGPDAQRAAIEAWAAREGTVIASWHADHGVSGAAPLDKRAGLLAAIGAARQGKKRDHLPIVVSRRDRLARDVVISAAVERLVTVVSAFGEGSSDDPMTLLQRRVADVFAEHERLIISARTKAALAAKRARGEAIGHAPYGWRAVGGRLEPDERESTVCRAVRELRDRGNSTRAIARILRARGVLGRTGKPLGPTQIQRIYDLSKIVLT